MGIPTVRFFVMRHGQRALFNGRKQDRHSHFGLDQLIASTEEHLSGVELTAAFCSDKARTMEAANHVLQHRDDNLIVVRHPAFAVGQYFDSMNGAELEHIEEAIGERGTAEEWLGVYSRGQKIAYDMKTAFRGIATDLTKKHSAIDRELNVLITYHAPFCNLAALDPSSMGPVGLADIIRYTTQKQATGWVMTESVHLRCPLTEHAE